MSKRNPFRYFLVLLFVSSFSLQSFAQADQAEAEIRAVMQQREVVGPPVAVVKKNKTIYAHSFGLKI